MSEEKSLSESVNGKVILLYQNSEQPNMEKAKEILKEVGVIAIACENPNNFRFVTPEIVTAANVDMIGRLALRALGAPKPLENFALSIRERLAPTPPAQVKK